MRRGPSRALGDTNVYEKDRGRKAKKNQTEREQSGAKGKVRIRWGSMEAKGRYKHGQVC